MSANVISGEIVEAKFCYEALKNGIYCFQSFSSIKKYDCLVEKEDNIYKVQVKSASYQDPNRTGYKFSNSNKKQPFGGFDILAGYVVDTNDWYFIPMTEIAGQITVRVVPTNKEHRFEKYRNAWYLFDTK